MNDSRRGIIRVSVALSVLLLLAGAAANASASLWGDPGSPRDRATLAGRDTSLHATFAGVAPLSPPQATHAVEREPADVLAPHAAAPLNLPLRGRHVLAGVVDTGIDIHNADFKSPNGSTRIKYIWDQTQNGRAPSGFTYGYECDSRTIDAGACPERDTDGHGTHVAGIAAGNGRSGGAQAAAGIAPGSDLIAVKTDLEEAHVIAAWKYMVARAKQLREPIIINNSFGGQNGPHDGSEREARAIDALSGPGVIFVTAAGNDANQGAHTDGRVAQGGAATITVTANGTLPELTFAVFYGPHDDLPATLSYARTGESFGPVDTGARIDSHLSHDGQTRIAVDAHRRDAGHNAVVVDVYSLASDRGISGTWRLSLGGKRVADGGGYNAWLLTVGDGIQTFTHPDGRDTLTVPADARSAISVGAYATHVSWTDRSGQEHGACDFTPCAGGVLRRGQIAFYSSTGPTADARQKPDIAAPGVLMSGPLSADTPICTHTSSDADNCIDPIFITRDGKHLLNTGTSAAAPYVAGVVALMLGAMPTLDPNTAITILRATAHHDRYTGRASWTPAFGAGKIDPAAAVRRILASGRG